MGITLRGVGACPGVARGPVRRMGMAELEPPVTRLPAERIAAEQERAGRALAAVAADLRARGNLAGGEAQAVLGAQALMALDPEAGAETRERIAAGAPAARAVHETFRAARERLLAAGGLAAGRAADLDDVRNRAVARLLGVPMPAVPDSGQPFVLVARDLAPADTALLDRALVLGFVTEEGGPTSHTALLARGLGVPAVVSAPGVLDISEGTLVAVDGTTGEVVVAEAG